MMQPIRILDLDFKLICEIKDYETLTFVRNFSTYGSFELKINKNKSNTQFLKKGYIIYLTGKKAGFILHRSLELGGTGKASEILTIKGYTLECLLSQRITDVPSGSAYWTFTGVAETGMKQLVNYNIGSGANKAERIISNFLIATTQGKGSTINISTRYKDLDEELATISADNGLGIKVELDYVNKKFVFDVYEGNDVTTQQSVNPPVIFAVNYGNIDKQTFIDSILDYKTTAIVAGEGEGAARVIQIVERDGITRAGIDRREMFVDARDISSTSNITLNERGIQKLQEVNAIYTLEGSIRPFNTFKFEADYFLGDLVTIKFLDIEEIVYMHTRIIQVKEYWSDSGYDVEVTFGSNIPNLIDKIKLSINKKATIIV